MNQKEVDRFLDSLADLAADSGRDDALELHHDLLCSILGEDPSVPITVELSTGRTFRGNYFREEYDNGNNARFVGFQLEDGGDVVTVRAAHVVAYTIHWPLAKTSDSDAGVEPPS